MCKRLRPVRVSINQHDGFIRVCIEEQHAQRQLQWQQHMQQKVATGCGAREHLVWVFRAMCIAMHPHRGPDKWLKVEDKGNRQLVEQCRREHRVWTSSEPQSSTNKLTTLRRSQSWLLNAEGAATSAASRDGARGNETL